MFRNLKLILFFLLFNSFLGLQAAETDWSNESESQLRVISPYTTNNDRDVIIHGNPPRLHHTL